MKCRGCGDDTRDIEVKGLGWMHFECEIKRLNNALKEANDYIEELEDKTPYGLRRKGEKS